MRIINLDNISMTEEKSLSDVMQEFLQVKKAQHSSDLTIRDYNKTFDKFLLQSANTMDEGKIRQEVLNFFQAILTAALLYIIGHTAI